MDHHPYDTRQRHSSSSLPPFPPPNVVLHPDDASSKVFLAVARAFVSVDNRAMTVKDIAEKASHFGLVCQNLSAAAQAVTTYLRSHKARCDRQEDQPLLLSHVLSGTPSDDNLVPALFSRSAGDSHPPHGRLTSFRKGTAVWYLSRATGLPCPFSRAGIRLSDYFTPHSPDHIPPIHQPINAGHKRKRNLSPSPDTERPHKVKLTLRLKPLIRPTPSTSSCPPAYDSDSMSLDDDDDQSHSLQLNIPNNIDHEPCLPPYPRRSISIPSYTPYIHSFYPRFSPPVSNYKDPFRRSPSTALSLNSVLATPPPDSDDDADDFHIAMTRQNADRDDDLAWDADLDSEGEGEAETVWESPGPRSPSAPLLLPTDVAVKEEPTDVQGMLDAWEDFDSTLADARMADVLAKALHNNNILASKQKIKLEIEEQELIFGHDRNHDNDLCRWDEDHIGSPSTLKQEELSTAVDSLFPPPSSSSESSPSPPDIINYSTLRPRARTVPVASPFFPCSAPASPILPHSISVSGSGPPSGSNASSSKASETSVPSTALVTLLQALSVNTANLNSTTFAFSPPAPCVSPLQTRCQPVSYTNVPVVVHTCLPCKPTISATQIEDISVYQMMLGAFQLFRRIDTDFVNLSPILAYSGGSSSASIPNATVVTKGSPEVCGTWVPLEAARTFVRENLSEKDLVDDVDGGKTASAKALEVFLGDTLVEMFPPALQDFHRSSTNIVRGFNQFGRHFASTIQAASWEGEASGGVQYLQQQQHAGPLASTALLVGLGMGHQDHDVPLSATEQQLFHELCDIPDWDADGPESASVDETMQELEVMSPLTPLSSLPSTPVMPRTPEKLLSVAPLTLDPLSQETAAVERNDRPLRRSKRVADALAACNPPSCKAKKRTSRS